MKNKHLTTQHMVLIAVFTAVIVICAQIAIPLPGGVPFTLQTFAIALAGVVLGPAKGTMAVIIYILLGAVGAPVFAHASGGLNIAVAHHTSGFILSFPLISFFAGIGVNKNNRIFLVTGLTIGVVLNLIIGMLYFAWLLPSSLPFAFANAVLPFLIPTAIWMVGLVVMSKPIRTAIAKQEEHES